MLLTIHRLFSTDPPSPISFHFEIGFYNATQMDLERAMFKRGLELMILLPSSIMARVIGMIKFSPGFE